MTSRQAHALCGSDPPMHVTPMKELLVKAGTECGVGKKRLGNMMGFGNRIRKGVKKEMRGR